jgi:hypothetical protein
VRAATALGVAAQPPTRACGVHTTAIAKSPTVGLRVGRFLPARYRLGDPAGESFDAEKQRRMVEGPVALGLNCSILYVSLPVRDALSRD